MASCVITDSASGVAAKVAASGTVARGICSGVAGCSVAGTCGVGPNWNLKGMPGVCSGCPVPVPVGVAVRGCPGVEEANTGDFSGAGLPPYLGCTAFLALEVACLVGGGRARRSSRFCTTVISVFANCSNRRSSGSSSSCRRSLQAAVCAAACAFSFVAASSFLSCSTSAALPVLQPESKENPGQHGHVGRGGRKWKIE